MSKDSRDAFQRNHHQPAARISGEIIRRRVLIFKFGAIGDVVMTIPAMYEMHCAGYDVDWVCGSQAQAVLQCYSWIRTIAIDDRALLRGTLKEKVVAMFRLWRAIGLRHYQICAALYYDRRYELLMKPVLAQKKLLLSKTDRKRRLLPARHHADEFARIMLEKLDTCNAVSRQPVRPDRLPKSPLGTRRAEVRIALVPGGASNMLRQQTLRRWPVETYVDLARQLLKQGYEIVLVGGPDDAWIKPMFEGLQVEDMIGSCQLAEVIALFDDCDLVVSHDTGPMHLAGVSGAALIGLFGPTDPGNFLPRRPGVRGIWGGEGFACRPCHDGVNFAPCVNNGCVQQITPDMVISQINVLLRERSTGRLAPWRTLAPSEIVAGLL